MSRTWAKPAAAVPVLAVAGLALAGPAGGQANGQGYAMLGDLDGDGVIDRATLTGSTDPAACHVVVELGDGSGGYGPPTTYTFATPPDVGHCPDMGVVADLGGDGVVELVLAWFNGRPPGVDDDLLVLRDYEQAGGFDAILQPSAIGTADFNGDGLVDVYEYTDQGDGFQSWLNTPSSRLTPGPVRLTGVAPVEVVIGDFDEDGAADVVINFVDGFPGPQTGVTVVLDDGTTVPLRDHSGYWDIVVADGNDDGHLDVGTTDVDTGEVLNFWGNGDGTFTAK